MSTDDVFYGQEEEDFEELMEKNLGSKIEHSDDDRENEEDILSDIEELQPEDDEEDLVAVKREQRLQTVMHMTRNPLASMNFEDKSESIIKQKVTSLCTALGGFDPNPPNSYILGIEAAGCLRDLKTLLKRIDEEKNQFIVSSACHDSGLFVGDLIPIFIHYGVTDISEADPETVKILLATLELMVRLLTPIRMNEENNDDKLLSKLRRAQIEYKYHLLHHQKGKVFKYIIALMIPILKLEKKMVTRRDNIILNLCLTLFANVLRIQPSDAKSAKKNRNNIIHIFEELPLGMTEEDIGMDIVLRVFKKYQVLTVVQTIASNLSKEFETEILGTSCLDFYYYCFLYIDPKSVNDETAIKTKTPDSSTKKSGSNDTAEKETTQLKTNTMRLLQLQMTEHENFRQLKVKGSTRHANFGSLINIQDKKHGNRVFSGQDKLRNKNMLQLLDSSASKTSAGKLLLRRPKSELSAPEKFLKLNSQTRVLMNRFIQDFIENGFAVVCKEIYEVLLKNSEINDFTFHFHYFFVVNWIFTYEADYQSKNPKDVKTVERYKYLFYCLNKLAIKSLIINFIPKFDKEKQYDCLNIAVSVLTEILKAVLTMHSYRSYDNSKLLNDDKLLLKVIISRGEAALRLIFEVNSDLNEILKLTHDPHKKSYSLALRMVEFTSVVLKILSYISKLSTPIMFVKDNKGDINEDGMFQEDENARMLPKNLQRYKLLDKNQCEKYKDLLFHDKAVNTHVWLFYQFKEIDESRLTLCLSYFSMLLVKWRENILKLVRLDFMYALYELKNSEVSERLKRDFGDLMNFFMHKFVKLCSNTKLLLLKPMSSNDINDVEIKQYCMTGDPFASSDFTYREGRQIKRKGNEDIKFIDESISDNQKISLLVSRMFYDDKIALLEQLIEYINQWYHELSSTITSDVKIVGKLESFRLEGAVFKETRINPYFRLLCHLGSIINGILIMRDSELLQKFKSAIEITLNTPLDSYLLDDQFDDPNVITREMKKQGLKRRTGAHNSGYSDNEADDNGAFTSYLDGRHGYGEEGINDEYASSEDLAGSESEEVDELELLEAKLSRTENRIKGKAMKRSVDGKLIEMGGNTHKKKKSSKDKHKNRKRLRKKRKIVKDDDEILSDREIMRRAHLSKQTIVDSDEDMSDDEEFFAREMKLQQLLQKRHGLITKEQYNNLMDGTLNIDDVSDLDDHLIGETSQAELGPQTAHSRPDRDSLLNLLRPSADAESNTDSDDSESDSSNSGDTDNDCDNDDKDAGGNSSTGDENSEDENEGNTHTYDKKKVIAAVNPPGQNSCDDNMEANSSIPQNITDLDIESESGELLRNETTQPNKTVVALPEVNTNDGTGKEATDQLDKGHQNNETSENEVDIFADLRQLHDMMVSTNTE